jgi:hypothetical protein
VRRGERSSRLGCREEKVRLRCFILTSTRIVAARCSTSVRAWMTSSISSVLALLSAGDVSPSRLVLLDTEIWCCFGVADESSDTTPSAARDMEESDDHMTKPAIRFS